MKPFESGAVDEEAIRVAAAGAVKGFPDLGFIQYWTPIFLSIT